MAEGHMTRCSTRHRGNVCPNDHEMSPRPSVRLTSAAREGTSAGEDVQKGGLVHCWRERRLVWPLWTLWTVLRDLKIKPSCDPGITLLGLYLRNTKHLQRCQQAPNHGSSPVCRPLRRAGRRGLCIQRAISQPGKRYLPSAAGVRLEGTTSSNSSQSVTDP